jgi:drug/metabolite transporter (DMT)-like permease
MFALDLSFWNYGVRYTSVANSTVLANLTPVVVTAIAWAFLGQRPRRLFLLALASATAGAWLMAREAPGGAGLAPRLGDALSASASLWYALYMLAISQGRKQETASALMFWSSAAGAPLVLAAAVALKEPILPAGPAGWAACAALGLVHVAGQGSIAWAMGRLPAATVAVAQLVQPVIAALLGWLIFAEVVSPLQALGAAVALAGVVLAQSVSTAAPPSGRSGAQ